MRPALLLAALPLLAGCPETSREDAGAAAPNPAAAAPADAAARVAPDWQAKLFAMASADVTDAYALFSEGGWSDAGQVVVFATPAGRRLVVVPPGGPAPTIDRALTEAEWKALAPATAAAASLPDVDVTAFDALVWEYVHQRKGATVKRLFVRNPGTKATPEHDEVFEAFQALRKGP